MCSVHLISSHNTETKSDDSERGIRCPNYRYIITLRKVTQLMHCEKLWAGAHGIRQDSSIQDESHCLELSQRTSVAVKVQNDKCRLMFSGGL